MTDYSHASIRRKIIGEQIRLIYGLSPVVAIGSALVAIGFTYALWGYTDTKALTYWLFTMLFIAVARVAAGAMFSVKNPGDEVIQVWMWLNVFLLFFSGMAWGVGSVILFPEDSVHHQALIYFCLSGMTAGSLGAFSARREAVWAFIFPALIPMMIFLFFQDPVYSKIMAAIMALYLFVLFYSSIHLHNSYTRFLETAEALKAEVSCRQKAEDQLRTLNNAIEQLREVVVITNSNGSIEYANPALENITGYSAQEAIGENPRIFNSGVHSEEFFRDLWGAITVGLNWSGVITNRKKSGELYEEEVTISPVKNSAGDIEHFVAIKRDISDRIRAEEELKESKDRAEKATKLKDEFVLMVSHDLKNPVSSLSGLAKLLKTKIEIPPKSDVEKIFNSISESCESLFEMLEKLLDVSRFHTGDISVKHVDVNVRKACLIAIGQVSHLAHKKGVKLTYEMPDDAWIYADEALLNTVIGNLVSNAVKFTSPGDSIVVYSPPGKRNSIAVKDTGIGIDRDVIENLFKGEVKTTKEGTFGERGTGLGLPFCYDIMIAHGGSLTVESTIGEGSIFSATFPGKPENAP